MGSSLGRPFIRGREGQPLVREERLGRVVGPSEGSRDVSMVEPYRWGKTRGTGLKDHLPYWET